LDLETIEELRN